MLSMFTYEAVRTALVNGTINEEIERDASMRATYVHLTCKPCGHRFPPIGVTDTFVESMPKAQQLINDAVLFHAISNACDCHSWGSH
jgi:hypothetical protein